ncbi:endonuclease/exonuclease/phosphatase family protein [Planctomycetes bacterium K23_9]|uniref:Endonuclease/Exonuclease/phosphatase family protein n=1 Tax=Stieleria marina TaxID=1930275 RepID=A0A517P155_9BACT|nr:Endonuclease/Exonuclease/phosphatase family protein [Planctomycetes bacterium K23_9]
MIRRIHRQLTVRWLQRIASVGIVLILTSYVYSRVVSMTRLVEIECLAEQSPWDARENTTSLRIATFNIAHGRGLSTSNWTGETRQQRIHRLDAIAAELRRLRADVVVLNEVDFDASWSHHVDQARYVANRSGYKYIAKQSNFDFRVLGWTWKFGNAVLSKQPISQATLVDLPGDAIWETVLAGKKRALDCEIQLADQSKFHLVAVHLSPRSEHVRVESITQLVKLAQTGDSPFVLAGDFNAAPPSCRFSQLSDDQQNTISAVDESRVFRRPPSNQSDAFLTFPADKPDRVIDWILVPSNWIVDDYWVKPIALSDHRPVIADIRFGERSLAPRDESP